MNKIVIALAATTAFAGAAPAAAQYGMGGQIRSDQLQMQLQAGIRSGAITRAEAMPLRQQLMQLTRLERLYARDGISRRERADLQHRINTIRRGIRMAERGGDGRYGRDDDRYDRDVRYGDRDGHDRNDDGRDDRDRDRDGRWDNRGDSDRGRWDDRDRDRDERWDNDDVYDRGRGDLRVGQRAPDDLGALPYGYRNDYRDGASAYYRSDGRRIYQIDPRTHTVVRIYEMTR